MNSFWLESASPGGWLHSSTEQSMTQRGHTALQALVSMSVMLNTALIVLLNIVLLNHSKLHLSDNKVSKLFSRKSSVSSRNRDFLPYGFVKTVRSFDRLSGQNSQRRHFVVS